MLHSHLGMVGVWGVYGPGRRWGRSPRRAWIVLRARRPRSGRVRRAAARADDRGADAVRPATGGARPRRARDEFDRERFLRACGRTIRRARSATRCSTSATSPASATSGRPRGAGRRASTRGARSPRSQMTRPVAIIEAMQAADACARRPGPSDDSAAGLRHAGRPCPRCGAAISRPRAGRREPDDILVPGMPELDGRHGGRSRLRRVGHKGADLHRARQHVRELRRGARGRRRHDRVRRAARGAGRAD